MKLEEPEPAASGDRQKFLAERNQKENAKNYMIKEMT
jgi:hypothetical protein